MNRVSRRDFIKRVGGGLAAGLIGISCAPLNRGAQSADANSAAVAPNQPTTGGTFVLGTIAPAQSTAQYPQLEYSIDAFFPHRVAGHAAKRAGAINWLPPSCCPAQ